jgi:PAS domain S-box-containing protein
MKKGKGKSPHAAELRRKAETQLKTNKTQAVFSRKKEDLQRLLHELQVHQVELEMQNEELRETRREIEAALEKYSRLYDFAPVGYVTLDRDGAIREVNLAGAGLLGRERSRLRGRTFTRLVSTEDRAAFGVFLEKVFEGGTRESCEVRLWREGNRPLHVQIEAEASDDGQECHAMFMDITERKQIENAHLFLLECGLSVPGEDFFRSLARYLAESLRMDYVCIDRLERDSLSARTVAVYFDGKFEDNVAYALKDTPCGEVVGKTVCVFDKGVRHLFPNDPVLREMKAESYVGTTLWSSQGQPIGLIAMIGRQPLTNPRPAESMLRVVAIRAAGELERKEAEKELRRLAWMLTPRAEAGSGGERAYTNPAQPYGDLSVLNTSRLILDSVGKTVLTNIASGYLSLMDSSLAVYERNGDYALSILSSGWCRRLDLASRECCDAVDNREALKSGRWICRESCWMDASRPSIERGEPVDAACCGGIRHYAVPIRAGSEIIGSISIGYGAPPQDPERLRPLAEIYGVSAQELSDLAQAVESRPAFIIELAKKLLHSSARLIGEIVERKQELQDLSLRLVTVQEEERRSVARELHDSLGGGLMAMKFALENELDAATRDRDPSRTSRLEALIGMIGENLKETKRVQKRLHPPVLDDFGILAAAKALCRDFHSWYPAIRIKLILEIQEEDVPEELKITLYRVVQEGLNNIARHSGARSARITLAKPDGLIHLSIADRGRGFDLREYEESRTESASTGIVGMRERTRLSGGVFSILTSPGKGTAIHASWPCPIRPPVKRSTSSKE